jgi:hypothetical protein
MKNIYKKQIIKGWEFFPFNIILKLCINFFFINFDYALHAPSRSKGLEHLTLGLLGQFLLIIINWLRRSIYNWHLWSAMRTPTIDKILFISIWLTKIMRTCNCPHRYDIIKMYQIHVPQVGSQLLHWFLWGGINLHIQVQSFVAKPHLHIQRALTLCNIELAKAITNVHHIDQPKSR